LFKVPWAAAAGGAECRHDFEQPADVLGGLHAVTLARSR
jgi:hypothetical protein